MKGFGTVVTGTLIAGTIRREDELEVFPTGRRVRVRGAQVHGQIRRCAVAGQRVALNLAGASTEDLSRGMTLAPPSTFETTRRADVHLRLLASAPHALKNRARVHFHSYTMETVAEIVLTGQSRSLRRRGLRKAQTPAGFAAVARRSIHLRQFSPVVTIGGGVVLDAMPIPRMPATKRVPRILADGNAEAILEHELPGAATMEFQYPDWLPKPDGRRTSSKPDWPGSGGRQSGANRRTVPAIRLRSSVESKL